MSDELIKKLDEFELSYLKKTSSKQNDLWTDIKTGIEGIIASQKVPYISKRLELPLILFATPEIVGLPESMGDLAPIISTVGGGGLGNISGALISELDRQGVNIRALVPEYRKMFKRKLNELTNGTKDYRSDDELFLEHEYERMRSDVDNSKIILVEDHLFWDAEKVYVDWESKLDQVDFKKACAFQSGIMGRLFDKLKSKDESQKPRYENILIHCNDWMTGLIPPAAKSRNIMTLMTLHNIFSYKSTPKELKGHSVDISPFWKDLIFTRYPSKSLDENFESNGVDLLASGIYNSDHINTVSPMFLKELVADYFRKDRIIEEPIRDLIKKRNYEDSACGILNAASTLADPRTNPNITHHYWIKEDKKSGILDVKEGKIRNKSEFQERMNLERNPESPILFWPSRVADPQKGFELLTHVAPEILRRYNNMQIAVVGDPVDDHNKYLVEQFLRFQHTFHGRIGYAKFSEQLSYLGFAGSDFLLMPSKWEPCGIPPLEGPIFGTPTIGRRTGGMVNSIDQLEYPWLIGNGFLFTDMDKSGFEYAIDSAMKFYDLGIDFRTDVQKRIMQESIKRFSISEMAKAYIEVYNKILYRRGITQKVN